MTAVGDEYAFESIFQPNVSWSDIMDAEESGDPMELEKLKNVSFRSNSSLSKDEKNDENILPKRCFPQSPASSRRPLLQIQCRTPGQDSYTSHSRGSCTSTPAITKPKPMTYADVLKPNAKRTLEVRHCLSPVEGPSKKHHTWSSPQFTEIEEPPKEQTPIYVERSQKFTQRKLAFVSKFDLADEEPIPQKKRKEKETDPHRLEQRQKQIDYGKNTVGYEIYSLKVPRELRSKSNPSTPDKCQKCSKRSWDGQIRKWRRGLHAWDPKVDENTPIITAKESDLAGIDLDMDFEMN